MGTIAIPNIHCSYYCAVRKILQFCITLLRIQRILFKDLMNAINNETLTIHHRPTVQSTRPGQDLLCQMQRKMMILQMAVESHQKDAL